MRLFVCAQKSGKLCRGKFETVVYGVCILCCLVRILSKMQRQRNKYKSQIVFYVDIANSENWRRDQQNYKNDNGILLILGLIVQYCVGCCDREYPAV
jgi:hypothetical protein